MSNYDFKVIEKKWQEVWAKNNYGRSEDFSKKPKHYHLVEFPYPSGAGLHVGHCMGYGASDAYSRMKRMQGFNVMYPMGWDAFGLPTENYAIANKVKPQKITEDSIAAFKRQMKMLGYSFDWDREVNTTDPNYYKWTQWIFLQFYRHGYIDNKIVEVANDDVTTPRLAFQAEIPINWCPSCKIGLANEEVIAGRCERCDTEVIQKMQKQWMLRITAYADRLIEDLDTVDYLEKIKTQQINWIGKSEGANVKFEIRNSKSETNSKSQIQNSKQYIEVYTTRADTLFACTYVVVAPESDLISNLKNQISNLAEVEKYIENAKKKTDLDRTELEKDKTGVELKGISAINPINNEKVPVWVADYCLASYGTGAVMAVPAHDQRDFEFATKYNIAIRQSVAPYYTIKDSKDAIRPDKETVHRKMIVAIIKHWNEDKIFCLDWEKFNWHSFILGGIDEGEKPEDAARREVIEESGYKNFKSVKKIGFRTHSNFFAEHKDVNRYSDSECFVVELADGEHEEPSEEHTKNHKGLWIDSKKAGEFVNLANNIYYFDIFAHGEKAFCDYGKLVNSGEFDDLVSEEAKKKITEKLKGTGAGEFAVNYKLRDWVFSRQHYWGEPIPIVHCEKDGIVPLLEKDLPLELPEVENYEPSNTGESPLATISDWVNTTCPKCGGPAKRETDTMPNWAGSSWYFLRYTDPENNKALAAPQKLDYWLPVDLYNGGTEHTTLHLLYSRFWHKFLFDLKVVPTLEPYQKRITHGFVLGPDNQKMSKSRGNVINPDEMVKQFGADTLRAYIMFIGPFDADSVWNMNGIKGVFRFLNRVWANTEKVADKADTDELLIKLNQTVAGVSEDLETFQLNTVISKLMEFNNAIEKAGFVSKDSFKTFLKILSPVTPHIAEELWEKIGGEGHIYEQGWPKADEKYLMAPKITIAVQVNGKTRDMIEVASGESQEKVETAAQTTKVKNIIADKKITKVIYVSGKVVNFVLE